MTPNQRPDMQDYRGSAADSEDRSPDPVADNPNPPPAAIEPDTGEVEAPPAPPPEPQGPPSDAARDAIAKKFRAKSRAAAAGNEQDRLMYGQHAPVSADIKPPQPAVAPADASPSAHIKPPPPESKRFKLKVDGDEFDRDIADVARLADMTVEEVEADPDRATRYAQKEIASDRRLSRAKDILRSSQDRPPHSEPPADRSRADARPPSGNQSDQPSPDSTEAPADDISEDDLAAIFEEVQLGDSKDAAKRFGATIRNLVTKQAATVAEQRVTQSRGEDAIAQEQRSVDTELRNFATENTEFLENPYLRQALFAAGTDEMSDDLRSAGVPEDILANATPEQIRSAHTFRRSRGEPGIRRIDKAFLNTARERLSKHLTLPARSTETPPTTQDLTASREARKENLRPQPKRANVPPQTRTPAPAPMTPLESRKAAVRAAAAARGQAR